MSFADIGGVPAVMAANGTDNTGLVALLATLMKDDDRGHNWMGMMWLFVVFAILILVIMAIMWNKREKHDYGYAPAPVIAAPPAYGYGGGHLGCDHAQSHREHWDQIRDQHKMEIETKNSFFEASRQADFNHYTASREASQNHHETTKQISDLNAANERQTLLLMREMDRNVIDAERDRANRAERASELSMFAQNIINQIAPRPMPVNQIWGQLPLPAHMPAFSGC